MEIRRGLYFNLVPDIYKVTGWFIRKDRYE